MEILLNIQAYFDLWWHRHCGFGWKGQMELRRESESVLNLSFFPTGNRDEESRGRPPRCCDTARLPNCN